MMISIALTPLAVGERKSTGIAYCDYVGFIQAEPVRDGGSYCALLCTSSWQTANGSKWPMSVAGRDKVS